MAATKTNGLQKYFRTIRRIAKDRGITFQQAKEAYVAEKNGTHGSDGFVPPTPPTAPAETLLANRCRVAREFIDVCGGLNEAIYFLQIAQEMT